MPPAGSGLGVSKGGKKAVGVFTTSPDSHNMPPWGRLWLVGYIMDGEFNEITASSESNPRAASTRIKSGTATTISGQIRHDLRRGPQPLYVDAKRSHLNRILIQPATPVQLRKICEERRELRDTQRKIKRNTAVGTVGIITFGSEAAQMFEKLTPEQQDSAFRELADAIAARLATSLHALTIHLDEATIHAHYTLAAYNKFGDPISKSTSPRVLSELQDITAEIMSRHCPGIERGTKYGDRLAAGADFSDVVHKSVRELHRTLPADLAAKRSHVLDLAKSEIEALARVEEMQARVQKLEGKIDLTDKEVKRLEVYRSRLADRIQEAEKAETAARLATEEQHRLADLARADRDADEVQARKILNKVTAVQDAVSSLTKELSDGTITRTPEGKVRVAAPEKLRPGYPEIGPAVSAAADLAMTMTESRKGLDRRKADLDLKESEIHERETVLSRQMAIVSRLREELTHALQSVRAWLTGRSLTKDERKEAVSLLENRDSLLPSPEDPGEDSRLTF